MSLKQLKGHLNVILLTFVLSNKSLLSSGQQELKREVCYEIFGCFTWTKYVYLLPDSPEKIGATFRVYTADDVYTGNRTINYHDETNYDLFNNTTSVVFIMHGWLDNGQEDRYRILFTPLLTQYDLLVSVDWSKSAKGIVYPKNVANSQLTGREIGYLLHRLHSERNIDPSKVHLIGFSLGAHVAGLAGRWSKQQYGLTVGRVTGLDAAGPLIEGTEIHLNKNDALYVDGIHTSSGSIEGIVLGRLGTKTPFGHKDFYPNGGSDQPFCPFPWLDIKCRHYAAIKFFLSSIDQCEYKSTKCDSWKQFTTNSCEVPPVTARMGLKSIEDPGEGSFYIETGKDYPYYSLGLPIFGLVKSKLSASFL